jgi:hypothetical protein
MIYKASFQEIKHFLVLNGNILNDIHKVLVGTKGDLYDKKVVETATVQVSVGMRKKIGEMEVQCSKVCAFYLPFFSFLGICSFKGNEIF